MNDYMIVSEFLRMVGCMTISKYSTEDRIYLWSVEDRGLESRGRYILGCDDIAFAFEFDAHGNLIESAIHGHVVTHKSWKGAEFFNKVHDIIRSQGSVYYTNSTNSNPSDTESAASKAMRKADRDLEGLYDALREFFNGENNGT